MRRIWIAASLALLGCSGSMALSQSAPAPMADAPAPLALPNVQAMADRYVAEKKTPGIAIAIGIGDLPTTFVNSGNLAFGADSAPVDQDSLWRVYSMTKPVTAMAAMILIEEGKLKLDQPISDFFPAYKSMKVLTDPDNSLESRPAAREITVRHLLTHTAGLGYTIITKGPLLKEYERLGIVPYTADAKTEAELRKVRPATLQAFAERVATLPLIADPGTKWSYSIGLDVLAAVVEKAGGMPFEQFVQTRILDPLDMKSSYWTVPTADAARLSTAYIWAGEVPVPIDPGATSVTLAPPSFPYGGAGLMMSARDYDRFLHMLQNYGALDGTRIMKVETAKLAMSNLLPDGVTYGGVVGATGGATGGPKLGFGAGGSVYLEDMPGGPGKGTYGWGGAAGTIAWVDPEHRIRGTVMVNYIPADKWPLRADVVKALASDLVK